MKTARNIALILMCTSLVATVVVGCVLLSRVLEILMPSAPQTDPNLQATPSSSSSTVSTPPSTPPTVPPTSSTAPLHQCEFTIQGNSYAPTCDMMGYTVYSCECGRKDYRDYVDSLGHLYSEFQVIPYTCTQDGWTERTCSRCNQVEKTDFTTAKHTYTAWSVTEDATRERRDCQVCGAHELRSTSSEDKWTIRAIPMENEGDYQHLLLEFRKTKNADPRKHHIYVGLADANVRFDYSQEYLLVYYTLNGEQNGTIIYSESKDLTIQPDGICVLGKPAGN